MLPRTAIALLLLTLASVVDALNPEIKAIFKDFAHLDIENEEFKERFQSAARSLSHEMIFNWNSTYAYKDDEDRLPEHDMVNMTLELYNKIYRNEGPEADEIWLFAITTAQYPDMPQSQEMIFNLRYLAEMYQGRFRFANVLQETWDGWNLIQLTNTMVLPNLFMIIPDGEGGHDMFEFMPLFTDIRGIVQVLENTHDARTVLIYSIYKMPRLLYNWELKLMNYWRQHYQAFVNIEGEVNNWLYKNAMFDKKSNMLNEFNLDEYYFDQDKVVRSQYAMAVLAILAICIALSPFVSCACFICCCCMGPVKRSAKKPAAAGAKVAPASGPKRSSREKLE